MSEIDSINHNPVTKSRPSSTIYHHPPTTASSNQKNRSDVNDISMNANELQMNGDLNHHHCHHHHHQSAVVLVPDCITSTESINDDNCSSFENECNQSFIGNNNNNNNINNANKSTKPQTTTTNNLAAECHSSSNEWIKLNVGGTMFQTTRTTLCSDRNSFFYRLLQEDSLDSEKDENGAYLIDRDPSYFAPILNFLRHGKLILNKDLNEDGVREEAEFYNITSLIKMLDKPNNDRLNRNAGGINGDINNKNHVYRLLHCCEGELSLAISTLSDGWKFEQLVPNFPNWTTDYFVVVSREYPIKR